MPGLLDYTKKNYEDGDTVNPMSSGLVANWLSRTLLDRGELIPNYGEFNRLLMNEPEPGDRLTPEEEILKELLGSALESEENKPISSPFENYQDGGNVDFDPYADTSLADQLNRMGISVDSDAMGLLPTYDTTGADIAREGYKLRSDATRRGATGNLFDLSRQSEIQAGQTGFAGAGAGLNQFENVREDIVSGYGSQAKEQYLDLQSDISGIQKSYERELVSAIGDLDEDSWAFKQRYGAGVQGDTYFGDPSQGGIYGTGLGGGSTSSGLLMTGLSDIRLKKDIEHLFTMDNGVPIYSFKYQWSDDTNIGTMAQDIEGIIPDAVSINSEGYKMVDYSKVFNHG